MNSIKVATSTLVLLMTISMLSALPASENDRSINDLYESLLQREYTGPIPLSDHQVERKAVRSPSLRLRFGRSDPSLMPLGEKRYIQEVNQKPIRSPSLRLRFGRRSDPMMPVKSDDYDFENYEPSSNLYDTEKRAPSLRLRYGRNSYPTPNELFANEWMSMNDNRASAVAEPRWGHFDFSGLGKAAYDSSSADDNDAEGKDKRAPAPRLRWGRSAMPADLTSVERALQFVKNHPKQQSLTQSGNN